MARHNWTDEELEDVLRETRWRGGGWMFSLESQVIQEITAEARRLERTKSWVMRRAWKMALPILKTYPEPLK